MGVLTGIIETIQATEVIKLITGFRDNLSNRILTFNLKTYSTQILKINTSNSIPENLPISLEAYSNADYPALCGDSSSSIEIDLDSFNTYLKDKTICFLDVRNIDETPTFNDSRKLQIPLDELSERINEVPLQKTIVVMCQQGIRSLFAAHYLRKELSYTNIFSLKNGIEPWFKQSNS